MVNIDIDVYICVKKGSDLLERVAVGIDFELAAVVCALKSNRMSQASNSPALIFPAKERKENACSFQYTLQREEDGWDAKSDTHHVAAVTRGILFSGAIFASSMGILER